MSAFSSPSRQRLGSSSALLAGLLGLSALTGWVVDIPVLTGRFAGGVAMMPTTAILVVLGALALHFRSRRTAMVAAKAVLLVAAATCAEYLLSVDLGIANPRSIWGPDAVRMAPSTAVALAALGGAIMLTHARTARVRLVGETLAALVLLVASFGFAAHLFAADMPAALAGASRMAVPTVAALVLLAVGLLATMPDSRMIRHLTSEQADGLVMRRLLPVVFSPILIGWLRLKGEGFGWYDTEFGIALHVFAGMLILAAATYWSVAVVAAESVRRQTAQAALAEVEHRAQVAIEGAQIGVWEFSAPSNELHWSPRCFEIFGMPPGPAPTLDDLNRFTHPDDRARRTEALEHSWATRTPYRLEYRIVRPDGSPRWIESIGQTTFDAAGAPQRMSGVFLDIDTRKSAEEALARSNADLERFAYVASHDLQEPLRMVASFVQLLGDRYKGKLDDTADEFIGFAVDGASRMQRMLEDLLAFSRLSRSQEPPVPTSAADALAAALRNLSARTEESHAVIEARSLPVVLADPSQLERVFTNLLGNALKFRNGSDPVVHVAADREGPLWHFRVRDNGIGIDPRYFERVFMLFQRLHTREHYEGNGMGLAITKRIIERWGGRIWVESEPNTGSTFHFTLHAPPGAPA